MSRAVLAVVAVVAVVVLVGGGAWGDEAAQSGWWTTAPVAVAPDAPADGLVIQGGPDADNPLAFAAISYVLAPDAVPQSLDLKVATGSASTPGASLAACPLTTTFAPAQGGASSSAPKYDCGTKVTASAAADGSAYTFDVANLVRSGALAIAVLPTSPTDRVVLQRPDAGALTLATANTTEVTEAPLDAGSLDVAAPTLPDLDAPLPAPDIVSTPEPAAAPSNNDTGRGATFANTPAAAVRDDDASPLRGLVFVGMVLTAALLWAIAGSRREESQ